MAGPTPRTLVQPPRSGWVQKPPQGLLSSCFVRDPRFGRAPGVYPVHANGTYALTDEDDLKDPAEKEIINLCYIPHGVYLSAFTIFTHGVTGRLEDSLPDPTVYLDSLAGDVVTMANMTGNDMKHAGTMYASTPRAIGKDGPAVVQWHQGVTLRIANAAGHQHHPTDEPLIFIIQWSPTYDAGV